MPEPSFNPLHMTPINWETYRIFNEHDRLITHESVIRPLLMASQKAVVYKGALKERRTPDGTLIEKAIDLADMPILKCNKGKYIYDITKECIVGHELLWNANGDKRGSIVLILPDDFDFGPIFPHCYDQNILRTPNAGHSPGAIKLCLEARDNNNIAVIFSASNGIQDIEIYASDKQFAKIINLAKKYCKDHRAWISETHMITECYKGNAKELWQYKQIERITNKIHDGISNDMSQCESIPNNKAVLVVRSLFSQLRADDILLTRLACMKLWSIPAGWLINNVYEIFTANYSDPLYEIDEKILEKIIIAMAHMPDLLRAILKIVLDLDDMKINKVKDSIKVQDPYFYKNTIEHMKYLGLT